MLYKNKKTLGFTLVELVVVTSIVSLLSSIVLTVFTTPRQKANDSARVLALKQIQNALELYYQDNKSYPDTTSATTGVPGCPTSVGMLTKCPPYNPVYSPTPTSVGTDWDASNPLRQLVTGRYIGKLPTDPLNRDGFWYVYRGNRDGYVLEAALENGKGVLLMGGNGAVLAWIDVNNNGAITATDGAISFQACGGVTPSPSLCSYIRDYNCDGTYTSEDIQTVGNIDVGNIPLNKVCRGN